MLSSISSSDQSPSDNLGLMAYRVLIAVILFWLIGMELICRLIYPHVSGGERQFAEEYRSVVEVGAPVTSTKQVIVLGNSLLDAGIHFERARHALLPDIDAKRLMFADTGYYDWYYGLRKLFADGARPHVVVLILATPQIVSSRTRGDYSAFHLMRTEDLFRVARDIELTNTETSSLAFANASAFFGFRAEIRRGILRRIFPDLPRLMSLVTYSKPAALTEEAVHSTAVGRLRELRDLALKYRSRVVLVVPPTGAESVGDPMLSAIQNAGVSEGVSVLVPVAPGSLGADLYSDSFFHLNERGADVFTPSFVESLRKEIDGHP